MLVNIRLLSPGTQEAAGQSTWWRAHWDNARRNGPEPGLVRPRPSHRTLLTTLGSLLLCVPAVSSLSSELNRSSCLGFSNSCDDRYVPLHPDFPWNFFF